MKKIIYTLGTSKRNKEEFLEILKRYNINVVFDVRRWPTSRWFEHFRKENLESFLKEAGIAYFHFEELGGYREKGYENYLKSKIARQALKNLLNLAKNKIAVIICAEKFPWRCHRFYLTKEIEKKGWQVIHLLDKEKTWSIEDEPREIKPLCQKFRLKGDVSKSEEKGSGEES